jgi:hypothetical protein
MTRRTILNTEPSRMRHLVRRALTLSLALSLPAARVAAQEENAAAKLDRSALAKQTQNPVADLVSIPFQFNFNSGGGLGDGTLYNLNVQPVIPVKVAAAWNVVLRTIVPYLSSPTATGDQQGGLGDIQVQAFLSPSTPGKLIWGVGPQFSVPTATNPLFRTGSWAVGPSAVVVMMTGNFVLGGLANQVWTVADAGGDPKVNQLLVQPFINYNFGHGWAFATGPIITANWEAESGQQWTVPLGGGIIKTTVFNGRPMNLGAQYYYNVVRPDAAPASQFRIIVALLYPSKRPPAPKP